MVKGRIFQIVGLVLAGLCLVRVFSVAAAMRDVESYPATESDDSSVSSGDSSSDGDDQEAQAEIKLSTPAESAEHVADDNTYDQVPGVERLRQREDAENTLIVPTKMGRSIAGASTIPPEAPSPVDVRPEFASQNPTTGNLSAVPLDAGVIEPSRGGYADTSSRPFTSSDAQERRSGLHRENLVASGPGSSSGSHGMGIRSEPGPETRIEPPVPESAAGGRTGVQEISLIVSDYGYFPSRLFVTQGVPVKIFLTTPSKVTMCFMADTFGVQKGVSPGKVEEVHFMPQQPGDYRFYCPVRSIEGVITVREPPTDSVAARAVASAPPPPPSGPGHNNEPKRANELRSLIED